MRLNIQFTSLFLVFPFLVIQTHASETLSGDWNGYRSKWSKSGLQMEMNYVFDYFYVTSGGINTGGEYLGNFDVVLNIDGEKLIGQKGAEYSLYIIGNHGDSPSQHAGDLQGLSNIDAPRTIKIYEAWVDQKLMHDSVSIRLGLYDLNSEFDVMETASFFINSSFGIGPDFSQSGLNGPSIFPTTSLALRLAYKLPQQYYAQTAIFDGVPGSLNNERGTHIRFDKGDGFLYTMEIGYKHGKNNALKKRLTKLALGSWIYSENFDDLVDADSNNNFVRRKNYGFYILSEFNIYRETEEQGVNLFVRYGRANNDINQISDFISAGVVGTGVLPGRNQDQIGIAVAYAVNGEKFRQIQMDNETPVEKSETAFELSYKAQISPWFSIQPDIQLILNPSMDPNVKDATVIGVRTELSF